jgi:hypothetical protein
MAFQVSSPYNERIALLPHALVLHVNPASMAVSNSKRVERIQTRGGYVEQHYGDSLDEISCDGSTGAFLNMRTGLASVERRSTIAWDRFRDLLSLYRSNGAVYDPFGNIVLQGQVLLLFDRGTYAGTFRTFKYEETDTAPYSFSLSWTFKVVRTVVKIPSGL